MINFKTDSLPTHTIHPSIERIPPGSVVDVPKKNLNNRKITAEFYSNGTVGGHRMDRKEKQDDVRYGEGADRRTKERTGKEQEQRVSHSPHPQQTGNFRTAPPLLPIVSLLFTCKLVKWIEYNCDNGSRRNRFVGALN